MWKVSILLLFLERRKVTKMSPCHRSPISEMTFVGQSRSMTTWFDIPHIQFPISVSWCMDLSCMDRFRDIASYWPNLANFCHCLISLVDLSDLTVRTTSNFAEVWLNYCR